jgi:23S rRNA pseudouridine2605 synthase
MSSERVQKILAQAGIASRRKSEELIQEGLVTINGKVAQLGDKAEWGTDAIKVKGKLLLQPETLTYLVFNKPKGVICMLSDPDGRPTLTDFIKKVKTRVFPIGRLDFNSEGLVLLTNDGSFAEKIQRREDIPRVYLVKVKGHPDEEMISRLKKGARLGTGIKRLFKPHEVRLSQHLANKTVIQTVILGSGAFDLKAYFELKGFLVEKITRTSFGHLTIHGLEPGHYRQLRGSQAVALLEQPELGMKVLEAQPRLKPRASMRIKPVKPEAAPAPRGQTQEAAGPRRKITPKPAPRRGARAVKIKPLR